MNERAEYKFVLDEKTSDKMNRIRAAFSALYDEMDLTCIPSRETSLAYTRLEEAQMWAIKGIAREVK